jgi:hypothetical protein
MRSWALFRTYGFADDRDKPISGRNSDERSDIRVFFHLVPAYIAALMRANRCVPGT